MNNPSKRISARLLAASGLGHFLPRDLRPKRSHERQRISLVRSVGQTLSSVKTAFQPPGFSFPEYRNGTLRPKQKLLADQRALP